MRASALDDAVDVVISGHSHAFTNALVPNQNGVDILVTQAFSNGTAYAEIDLELDPQCADVVSKTARIVTTFSDQAPGSERDAEVQALVDAARAFVAPLVSRTIASVAGDNTWDAAAADGQKIVEVLQDGSPLDPEADYRVTLTPSSRREMTTSACSRRAALRWEGRSIWTLSLAISGPSSSPSRRLPWAASVG